MWLFLLASGVLIAVKTTHFQLGVLFNFTVFRSFSIPVSAPVSQSIDGNTRKPAPCGLCPHQKHESFNYIFPEQKRITLYPSAFSQLLFLFCFGGHCFQLLPSSSIPNHLLRWAYCKIKFTLNRFHGNLTHGLSGSKAIISLFQLQIQACQKVTCL